jgi:cell division septum initiation protein DivIVA
MKMKYLEKQMRKSFYKNGKLKSYEISIGKNDISEDAEKFYQNDKGLQVSDVIICFKDDFDAIIQENKDLKQQIEDHQSEIKGLEAKIDEKSQSNIDNSSSYYEKLDELKKRNSTLKENHEKEMSAIDEDHQKEIKSIKDSYNKRIDELNDEIRDIKAKSNDEIIQLRKDLQSEMEDLKENQFDENYHMKKEDHQKAINDLTLFNQEYHMKISDHEKDISKVKDYLVSLRVKDHQDNLRFTSDLENLGFFEKHSSKFTDIIKAMKETDEKKLNMIDEDFSNYLIEASEDDNAIND